MPSKLETHIDAIIDAVIKAEVGNKPNGGLTNDPADGGGRTQYGISEKYNPEAWADGKVTEDESRAIYFKKYVWAPGFDKVKDDTLRHVLVDWGVTSGPAVAIKYLQALVGVKSDGVMGSKTLEAVNKAESRGLTNKLVGERLKMIARIVQARSSQLKYLEGWVNRCVEFLK